MQRAGAQIKAPLIPVAWEPHMHQRLVACDVDHVATVVLASGATGIPVEDVDLAAAPDPFWLRPCETRARVAGRRRLRCSHLCCCSSRLLRLRLRLRRCPPLICEQLAPLPRLRLGEWRRGCRHRRSEFCQSRQIAQRRSPTWRALPRIWVFRVVGILGSDFGAPADTQIPRYPLPIGYLWYRVFNLWYRIPAAIRYLGPSTM